MALKKNIPVYPADLFTWKGTHGFTEASDLKAVNFNPSQVWDDSCDVGFYLRSPNTGAKKLFTYAGHDHQDNEIVATMFESFDPPQETQRGVYKLAGKGVRPRFTLTIYND